jgi:hypothetical protein
LEEEGKEDDNGIEEAENGVNEEFGLEDNVDESPRPKVKRLQKNTKVVKKRSKIMEKIKPTHLKTFTCSGGATIPPST